MPRRSLDGVIEITATSVSVQMTAHIPFEPCQWLRAVGANQLLARRRVCRADRHHKSLVGNDHHRTGGFFSTGTVIKLSYAASVAMLLVVLAALIFIHQQKSADVGEPKYGNMATSR